MREENWEGSSFFRRQKGRGDKDGNAGVGDGLRGGEN